MHKSTWNVHNLSIKCPLTMPVHKLHKFSCPMLGTGPTLAAVRVVSCPRRLQHRPAAILTEAVPRAGRGQWQQHATRLPLPQCHVNLCWCHCKSVFMEHRFTQAANCIKTIRYIHCHALTQLWTFLWKKWVLPSWMIEAAGCYHWYMIEFVLPKFGPKIQLNLFEVPRLRNSI